MITLMNLCLYVIAASNNLLVLYKKKKTRKLYLLHKLSVLNLIFPPWPHEPASLHTA